MIDLYKYTDKEIKELLKSMVILVDSRENANSHILKWFDEKKISYKIEKLEFCDYSFLLPANSELGFNRDLYFADKIPNKKANITINNAAKIINSIVAGKNCLISIETGLLDVKDLPKSPFKTSFSHKTYCLSRGSSRFISFLNASTASAVALGPRANLAGSPGIILEIVNINIDTPNITNMLSNNLLII